jgi:hypothetical protein
MRLAKALGALVAVALVAASLGVFAKADTTEAGTNFANLAATAPATASVGANFDVIVSINGPAGAYQAVQWDLDYEEADVDIVSITKVPAAPANCSANNDNGTRVLIGCIDIFGANLTYSGDAWIVTAVCLNPTPTADFTLQNASGAGATTFVRTGISATDNQPIGLTNATVNCSGGAAVTPTFTPSPTRTATPTVQTGGQTVVPRDTSTATPVGTSTPGGQTPPAGETPGGGEPGGGGQPGGGGATPGGGTGPGGVRPPSTGDGSTGGSGGMTWLWLALAGTAIAVATGSVGLKLRSERRK